MPTIARIRFANVVYENRQKRYNDETFQFDGHNSAVLLENGGGKTVFVQTLLQAVMPHASLAGRKIRDTLSLAQSAAHIAVEWILQEHPRVYGLTVVTLFLRNEELHSYKYTYRYMPEDKQSITHLPFTVQDALGRRRPATAEEMHDYYLKMNDRSLHAKLFADITDYSTYLEKDFKLIHDEWASLATINSGEGDVAKFFEACKTTNDLVKKLLIPTVLLAITHEDKASFIQMFEEKRVNLRKSKQLKQQIKENRSIEQQVNSIMKVYESAHIREEGHAALQQQGKRFYQEARKKQGELTAGLDHLVSKKNTLLLEERLLQEQTESLRIAELKLKEQQALGNYEGKKLAYQESREQLHQLEQAQHTLAYLRDKQDRDSKWAQIQAEEESLRLQASGQQDEELMATLQLVHCQLRSVYDQKEALHQEALTALEQQAALLKEEMRKQAKKIQEQESLGQGLKEVQVGHRTKLEMLRHRQEQIAKQILANVQEQQVGEELLRWKKEAEYVQQALMNQLLLLGEKEREEKQKGLEVAQLREEEGRVRLQVANLENKLEENQRKHQEVLHKLRELPNLRNLDSLYIEQGKINAALGILKDRRSKELDLAKEQERRDLRLVDAYGEQEKFTFDAYLLSFLRNCDCVVESGTAYTERLMKEGYGTREELLAHFPLWPMSLIVQERDKEELTNRLSKAGNILTSPVFVMTTAEAQAAARGTYPQTTIWPEFWPGVLEEVSFRAWQEYFTQKAKESQEVRESKEIAYQEVLNLYRHLDEFFLAYPQAVYEKCQQDHSDLQEQAEKLKRNIMLVQREQQEASRALKVCQEAIGDLNGKAAALHRKIEQGTEWEEIEGTCQVEETALAQCLIELGKSREVSRVLQKEQTVLQAQKEQLDTSSAARKEALSLLIGEELRRELQSYSPLAPLLPEESLKAKRLKVKEELAHLNQGREVIENRIKSYRQEWEKFNRRLEGYQVDVPAEDVFPADGDVQLQNLQRDIRQLEPVVKQERQHSEQAANFWKTCCTRREERERFYQEKFAAPVHVFSELLSVMKERLSGNWVRIEEELAMAEGSYQHLQQEMEKWQKLITKMETSNGKLEFLVEAIPITPLTGEEAQSFPYKSIAMIAALLEGMEISYDELAASKRTVEQAKLNFEKFCHHSNFQNEKMRQSILNGIRQKQSYQQLVIWERELKQHILGANRVAEQNMQAYNEDIKHFINQLHLHLISICDEMGLIQKMTGVKVEEHYKTIYEIKTPVWEEGAAKEKLLEHLEWMTEQLAADSYKQEDGMEDSKKIRKNIENWLSPSYLFTRISPNKNFTVGVRKVSNDSRISNYPVDWATSNSWSGGEKWSKNMALFLGIQSYLVEKRQPSRQSKGHSRTVVLDNPFGQASSDHVLEPVFFIAEKLGFQVIALTALAEGKFLRDYFPIIYSCRLRAAVGGETSVMNKELHVNHAFFQDKYPQTLTRLGQVKQIELLS